MISALAAATARTFTYSGKDPITDSAMRNAKNAKPPTSAMFMPDTATRCVKPAACMDLESSGEIALWSPVAMAATNPAALPPPLARRMLSVVARRIAASQSCVAAPGGFSLGPAAGLQGPKEYPDAPICRK